MNEQPEANANDVDSWPLPTQDVVRELEAPAVVWSEAEPAATPPIRLPARG
jgi:hypothetical protein